MASMIVGQSITATGPAGDKIYFSLSIPSAGKYVLETSGTPSVTGIWGPFPPTVTPIDGPPYGKFSASGANAWGTRTLAPGNYLVRCTPGSDGSTTILIRPWVFWDYFRIWQHPSL